MADPVSLGICGLWQRMDGLWQNFGESGDPAWCHRCPRERSVNSPTSLLGALLSLQFSLQDSVEGVAVPYGLGCSRWFCASTDPVIWWHFRWRGANRHVQTQNDRRVHGHGLMYRYALKKCAHMCTYIWSCTDAIIEAQLAIDWHACHVQNTLTQRYAHMFTNMQSCTDTTTDVCMVMYRYVYSTDILTDVFMSDTRSQRCVVVMYRHTC